MGMGKIFRIYKEMCGKPQQPKDVFAKFFKSERLSCLLKVDYVITNAKAYLDGSVRLGLP